MPSRGGGPPVPRTLIDFEDATAVSLPSGEFDVDFTAHFVQEIGKHRHNIVDTIDIYVDGIKRDSERSGLDGRLHYIWGPIPAGGTKGNGRTQITVQVSGTTSKLSTYVSTPAPAAKSPAVASLLEIVPDEGTPEHVCTSECHDPVTGAETEKHQLLNAIKYLLYIFATTDDCKPVPGARVTWKCQGKHGVIAIPKLEDGGIAVHEVTVEGFGKKICFEAALPNGKNYSLNLYGQNAPRHEPPALPTKQGFWANFLHALFTGGRK